MDLGKSLNGLGLFVRNPCKQQHSDVAALAGPNLGGINSTMYRVEWLEKGFVCTGHIVTGCFQGVVSKRYS
jgi:hypothetical protein